MRNQLWTSRLVALMVTAVLASGTPAWADGRGNKRDRQARQAIQTLLTEHEGPVEITLSDGTRHEGRLEALGERSFLLVDRAGRMTQVAYRQVSQSSRMSPQRIAITAGVTAGVLLMVWCSQATGNVICLPSE